jgi:prolyl oligopeptidase
MLKNSTIALVALALSGCGASSGSESAVPARPVAAAETPAKPRFGYPQATRSDHVDTYHGVEVADPYRWLEDVDSDQTRRWIEAENRVTYPYLEAIPARARLIDRLTRIWDYEQYGVPSRKGGRYFYTRNDGLQNQSVLYWAPSLVAEPKVLIDPNSWSDDGTTALAGTSVSDDGRYIAYGVQKAGSDWREWKVRDIATGKDLPDTLRWIKFSGVSWSPDGKGFYYSRYPEPADGKDLTEANFYQKLYYHRLGDPQSADRLIFERPDQPKWGFGGQVSDDGRWLVVGVWKGTGPNNLVFVKDLTRPNSEFVAVQDEFVAELSFVDSRGTTLWFKTDHQSPRGKVVAVDMKKPARTNWKAVIPQTADTLRSVDVVGGAFFASYLHDAYSKVVRVGLDGSDRREVELPGIGSVSGFSGRASDGETFYAYKGFTEPGAIYRYDVASGRSSIFRKPKVDFDATGYETEQVFYQSKDGTRIPMFLVHKKGLALDGSNPTLLYGYGGFGVSLTPFFSVTVAAWLEMGGVFAMPNLRGGGEYGEEWHLAGTRLHKQNVFDDFIAAAEYLIAERYTSPAKLAIRGGSNGGLLVGAVMTQRPDLFGAALPAVGVMDMLRFHKFTIGWAWVDDYGSSDDEAEFHALRAYSPLHNLEPGTCYPATLVTTADHDDRVVPAHSFKFAAALQHAQGCDNPVLIRIQGKAGHGAGKPTRMKIIEAADIYAFLVDALDMSI